MKRVSLTVYLPGEGVALTIAQIAAGTISSATLHIISIHAISDFQWAGEWMMTDKIYFIGRHFHVAENIVMGLSDDTKTIMRSFNDGDSI
mgnify:CR=1 FL=1